MRLSLIAVEKEHSIPLPRLSNPPKVGLVQVGLAVFESAFNPTAPNFVRTRRRLAVCAGPSILSKVYRFAAALPGTRSLHIAMAAVDFDRY